MLKIISYYVLLLLLIMSDRPALADTFKCTRPDGSVFYTDDSSQVPRGCIIERVKDLPPVGVVPGAPLSQPLAPSAEKSTVPQAQAGKMKSIESFKNEASLLVEKFQSARHRAFSSSFVTDKRQARRELADIKAQKKLLLNEIDQSSLSSSEKVELNSLLSIVTE
jgi:hypothetical protein